MDSYGELSVDLYDDEIKLPEPAERPLLLANLRKVQAELDLFSLTTDNVKSKEMYKKNASILQESIVKLTPFLRQ